MSIPLGKLFSLQKSSFIPAKRMKDLPNGFYYHKDVYKLAYFKYTYAEKAAYVAWDRERTCPAGYTFEEVEKQEVTHYIDGQPIVSLDWKDAPEGTVFSVEYHSEKLEACLLEKCLYVIKDMPTSLVIIERYENPNLSLYKILGVAGKQLVISRETKNAE